jgi:hypothetical protein
MSARGTWNQPRAGRFTYVLGGVGLIGFNAPISPT